MPGESENLRCQGGESFGIFLQASGGALQAHRPIHLLPEE
jgi:hypothetical protein